MLQFPEQTGRLPEGSRIRQMSGLLKPCGGGEWVVSGFCVFTQSPNVISGVLRVGSDPDRSDQKIFAFVEPLRFACGKLITKNFMFW